VARRATTIAQTRAGGGPLLVLDAGDSLTGDQDPAKQSQGASSVAAMNRLGYDAIALGPQDLSLGLEALQQRIGESKFAVLSANAIVSGTGALLARPFVVRDLGGYRVALVGLTGGPGTAEIRVGDPVAAARQAVTDARLDAGVVLVLSHAGQAVDRQIAGEVPGISAVISGGPGAAQAPWISPKTGVPVMHADEAAPGHAGRILGLAQLTFDAQGRLVDKQWRRVPLGPEVADDPVMAAWVRQQAAP